MTVIVLRVLLDERTKRWGRWRPSAAAKRLGTTAIRLDRRINRDGWTAAEAVADLENRCVGESRAELEALVERIPRRLPRFHVSAEPVLDAEPSPERADSGLEMRERSLAAKVTRHALGTVLDDLPEAEQRLLELRFAHGWTVKRIAEVESVPVRPHYSLFERLLRRMRQRLLAAGVNWATVAQALGGEAEIDVDFGADPS